jgi:hypothetical protein
MRTAPPKKTLSTMSSHAPSSVLLRAMGPGGATDTSMAVEGAASSAPSSTATTRLTASYVPEYQRFVVRARDYKQQYSHIYTRRTQALRPVVMHEAQLRWQVGDCACRGL